MTNENKIMAGGVTAMVGTIATSVLLSVGLMKPQENGPREDGIARVLSNGKWLIKDHTHGDSLLHLSCAGCGDALLPLIDARVNQTVDKLGPAIATYIETQVDKRLAIGPVESR